MTGWLSLFIESFPVILLQGILVTIPLTVISFLFAMIIAVDAALASLAAEGELSALSIKYFGTDISTGTAE